MTSPAPPPFPPDAIRLAAARILRLNLTIYLSCGCLSLGLLLLGLFFPLLSPPDIPPYAVARLKGLLRIFLAMFFVAATIICIGIQWSAAILAARRFREHNFPLAVRTLALSHWLCFSLYALFDLAALYHRLSVGGSYLELLMAAAAAAFATYYFTRLPAFLSRRLLSSALPL